MDKGFVRTQIEDHQKEIEELNLELNGTKSASVRQAIQNRLSYLNDNQYRYIMQARALGMNEY